MSDNEFDAIIKSAIARGVKEVSKGGARRVGSVHALIISITAFIWFQVQPYLKKIDALFNLPQYAVMQDGFATWTKETQINSPGWNPAHYTPPSRPNPFSVSSISTQLQD